MADTTIKEEAANETSKQTDDENIEVEEDKRSEVASEVISSASKKLANLQRTTHVPREVHEPVDDSNAMQALDSL